MITHEEEVTTNEEARGAIKAAADRIYKICNRIQIGPSNEIWLELRKIDKALDALRKNARERR